MTQLIAPPRSLLATEYQSLLEFLNEELRAGKDWSIEQEYPTVFQTSNLRNLRVVKEEEKVLAHAAVRPFIVKSPVGLMKVAAIGSVVTDPAHRNQGLSRAVIESCLEIAQLEGCDIAVLWTNLFDFYKKLDFEVAGRETTLEITSEFKATGEVYRMSSENNVSAEALLKLFHRHSVTSMRKVAEVEKFIKIPNSKIHTCWNKQNQLLAYAVEGKGADLEGYIHEWGGDVTPLMSLFSHIAQTRSPLRILVPTHSENLIRKMTEAGAKKYDGFLCMMRFVDPDRMFRKIKLYAHQRGFSDLRLEREDQIYKIGNSKQIYTTDKPSDFIPLLFGPQKASEWTAFDADFSKQLEQVFPLPFWIWGWDSI